MAGAQLLYLNNKVRAGRPALLWTRGGDLGAEGGVGSKYIKAELPLSLPPPPSPPQFLAHFRGFTLDTVDVKGVAGT